MQHKKIKATVLIFTVAFFINACSQVSLKDNKNKSMESSTSKTNQQTDTATLGAGCFWCVEAIFQKIKGVIKVESGYSGGTIKNPTYKEVCTGLTGHAEVCQITYNTSEISFDELLEVFWKTHDPTTINRQGYDSGTQYRSAIFYHSLQQKQMAQKYKDELNKNNTFDNPVVTEISPFINFYKAEDYHQNYYNQNGNENYCRLVIKPKLEKFEKIFGNKLSKENPANTLNK
ncbi:MAG: peptide-methionine (S)-S-oxide reductase MsrA [Bacteroidetes bacterium]|nr:peptide-methionine (S)-S-oxide reductase MsrA [Bacteroidota bacterium]